MEKSYKMLGLTLLISFFIMYMIMFLNVDSVSHIYLSITRLYMSLLMIAPMAVLMIIMMKGMYPKRKYNIAIICVSIITFSITLIFLRNQTFVSDTQYMKAMIPHHSSAIMTSKNTHFTDAELKELSKNIIQAQKEEIAQMEKMIERIK